MRSTAGRVLLAIVVAVCVLALGALEVVSERVRVTEYVEDSARPDEPTEAPRGQVQRIGWRELESATR